MPSPMKQGQDLPDWAPVRTLPSEDETRQRAKSAAGCFPVLVLLVLVLIFAW